MEFLDEVPPYFLGCRAKAPRHLAGGIVIMSHRPHPAFGSHSHD